MAWNDINIAVRQYEIENYILVQSLLKNRFRGFYFNSLEKIKDLYFEWNNGNVYACHSGNRICEFSFVHCLPKFNPADDLKDKPIPDKFYLLPSGFVTAQENEITKYKNEPVKIFYYCTKHQIRQSAINFFKKYFPYRFVNFARWIRRRFIF